ncbi:hypothetical protein MPK71_gp191 [Erwinia phage pEa_SNUABM_1]|uniref:Uncharacterized protein n=1 Tax=Erwinia phage pEa_SNUABM_1 TaxID=2869543 RepID=A0AAE8BZN3_9CAUD|nr:hypothetical protein MPK71_gp191 [Erwinia phage pEa_SNUABM_1]QZE57400.1 hypothetical protein pEaSNUABM1_00191 [Erwinia phage pEa_SNUABM_1]
MQYLAAAGSSWTKPTTPDIFFFDPTLDSIDFNKATDNPTLCEVLRNARTVLSANSRTMITRGQKGSTYYLTELPKDIGRVDASDLAAHARSAAPYYGTHAQWQAGTGIPTNGNRIICLYPSNLGNRPTYMAMLGVRSGIPSSRTYTVYCNVQMVTVNGSIVSTSATGTYTPGSSPSGGTIAQGENNYFVMQSGYTHFAYPTSMSISDTGYGPSIVYPSVEADRRSPRIDQYLVTHDEVFNLTDGLLCTADGKSLIKLKKGIDYDVEDDCVAGTSYTIDFSRTQRLIAM